MRFNLKTLNTYLLLAAVIFLPFFSSCDRAKTSTAQISVAVPDLSSLSGNEVLDYIVVQATGDDMPMVQTSWKSRPGVLGDLKSPPEFLPIEIPTGENRLIQVFAAYRDDAADEMKFYYGDIEQNLSEPEVNLSVNLGFLNATSGEVGTVTGRYIDTGSSTGPSGFLNVTYSNTPKKPAVFLTQSYMLSGWFKTNAIYGVSLDYTVAGKTIFSQKSLESFSELASTDPNGAIMDIRFPDYWRGTTPLFRSFSKQHREIFGYFNNNSNSKYACYKNNAITNIDPYFVNNGVSSNIHYAGGVEDFSKIYVKYGGHSISAQPNCNAASWDNTIVFYPKNTGGWEPNFNLPLQPNDGITTVGNTKTVTWKYLPDTYFANSTWKIFAIRKQLENYLNNFESGTLDCGILDGITPTGEASSTDATIVQNKLLAGSGSVTSTDMTVSFDNTIIASTMPAGGVNYYLCTNNSQIRIPAVRLRGQ